MREGEPTKMCSIHGPGHSDEECPKRTKEGSDSETEKMLGPERLGSEHRLVFFVAFEENHGLDRIRAEEYAKQMVEIADSDSELAEDYFYVIKDDDKIVATGRLEIRVDSGGKKHAHLSSLTVHPEYEGTKYGGKKLSHKLTETRIEKARELGFSSVGTAFFSENPKAIQALAVKLNAGYRLVGFRTYPPRRGAPEMGAYLLAKNIDERAEEALGEETAESNLKDFKEIQRLTADNWVGVQVENEKLIFRKKKEL